MSYLVFARKFRPQKFEDVIGQEHITTTLKNAIREKKIAQSFLFSGTRGVGKTSSARILAKALNCEKAVTPEPCGQCASCREITQGNSLDVLEIDGASNRGIDEIRNLRENVKFKPARDRFKVYIIDEVHMLTQEAFNALLKTLEEPPEHVKFIFATTELHKVPLTILSRCQKFVFRKVATTQIVAKLKEIAEVEKLNCDEKALFVIAKAADGSLRDAEGLLDQVASFAKGKVTYSKVIDAFGIPADETFLAMIEAFVAKDAKRVLEIFSPLEAEGKDMAQFVRGLMETFRALLILKVTGGVMTEVIELAPETIAQLKLLKERFTKEDLLSVVSQLQSLLFQVRRSALPNLNVETALIRLAVREDLTPLSEILEKLNAAPAQPSGRERETSGTERPALPPRRPERSEAPPLSGGAPALPPAETPRAAAAEPYAVSARTAQAVAEPAGISLNVVERVWAEVTEMVKNRKISCGMFLAEAQPVEVEGDLVVLGLPVEFKFHKENLEKAENKKIVEETLQGVLNTKLRITFVITTPDKMSVAVPRPAAEAEKVPEIVESALKMFDGKIVRKS